MVRAKLTGEKVYLRALEREDIDRGWLDWINDAAINNSLAGTFPVTREDLERYYESSQPPGAVMFAVCARENDRYIGNARLSGIDWINRKCMYGRLMGDAEYRGRGYGTEALILLLRYGFHYLGMNRIFSSAAVKNVISLASNDKVGMSREGILHQDLFRDGRFLDTVALAMLREDFDRLHGDPETWVERDDAALASLED